MFLTENSAVENPFSGAPSCPKSKKFLSDDFFSLRFQSVQYDLQHHFAGVADEADRVVVLAHMYVTLWEA